MEVKEMDISEIRNRTFQVRRHEDRFLHRLVESIALNGMVQPLTVKERDAHCEVVLGERRLEALKALAERHIEELPAGMARVAGPGRIRVWTLVAEELSECGARALCYLDNEITRDLSPYEQAKIYQALQDPCGWTVEDLSARLSEEPSEIRWALSALMELPETGLKAWENGSLSTGHVRQILRVKDKREREKMTKRVLDEDLSVDRLAFLVDQSRGEEDLQKSDQVLHRVRGKIASDEWIGVRVKAGRIRIEDSRRGDRLAIEYESPEELRETLERLIAVLGPES